MITPHDVFPWGATTVTVGGVPAGIVCDGGNVWITDFVAGKLLRLNSGAAVLQTVTVGMHPTTPVFDGVNLWVPYVLSNSVSVVRASSGTLLMTLTGNGMNGPTSAAFDGQRVLVTNAGAGADSVSLWKAADLTAIGSFSTGPASVPAGAASDGVHFWITLNGLNGVARF